MLTAGTARRVIPFAEGCRDLVHEALYNQAAGMQEAGRDWIQLGVVALWLLDVGLHPFAWNTEQEGRFRGAGASKEQEQVSHGTRSPRCLARGSRAMSTAKRCLSKSKCAVEHKKYKCQEM